MFFVILLVFENKKEAVSIFIDFGELIMVEVTLLRDRRFTHHACSVFSQKFFHKYKHWGKVIGGV